MKTFTITFKSGQTIEVNEIIADELRAALTSAESSGFFFYNDPATDQFALAINLAEILFIQ